MHNLSDMLYLNVSVISAIFAFKFPYRVNFKVRFQLLIFSDESTLSRENIVLIEEMLNYL